MKNKTLIITNIILLVCIIVGLLVFMIFGMSGKFQFGYSKTTLVKTEEYELGSIDKISSDVKSYDIIFNSGENDKIKVEVYSSKKDSDDVKIDVKNKQLHMEQVGSTFCVGFCFADERIVLTVPKDLDIATDLYATSGDIKINNNLINDTNNIKTTSGDIDIKYVSHISAKSTSGEIKIGKLETGNVEATSGDIIINKGKLVDAKSTSGEIEINELTNACKLKTTSGDIVVDRFIIEDNSSVEATSGDIDITLVNDANIYAKTNSGSEDIKKSKGDYELNLKTTSGDITVK